LFLHGGPCETQSPYLSLFAPWEERYVVAQWDQRGAGRTYVKNGGAIPNPTFEQLTRDAAEVARYVRDSLGVRKLILVGHSWGSMLALSVARKHPELFSVLVGTGQVVSGRMIMDSLVSGAVARAEAANDAQATADLKKFGRRDLGDWNKLLNLLFKWAPPFSGPDTSFLQRRASLVGPPGSPTGIAAADSNAANSVCLPKFMPYVYDFDATAGGFELAIPFFVIQGRDDNRTVPEVARAFLQKMQVPSKGYTAIDGGHFACFDNPANFLNALDKDLRSVGIG
jgi:pimeloyl-ACP methyl ester carboxylesterase